MLKTLKKFGAYLTLALLIGLNLYLPVAAQTDVFSPLQDIKSELERSKIAVVDYSSPEGQWGSLTEFWRNILIGRYNNLADMADGYKSYFEGKGGIIDLEQKISLLEAKKSQALTKDEIKRFDDLIKENEDKLTEAQNDARDELRKEFTEILKQDLIPGVKEQIATVMGVKFDNAVKSVANDGARLLFEEIDFYFTYNKWGRLPLRVIIVLQDNFSSLEDLYESFGYNTEEVRSGLTSPDYSAEIDLGDDITESFRLTDDDIELIITEIQARRFTGERQIREITRAVVNVMRNLIGGLAVIWIVISGIRMVMAQGEESVITEQKQSITYALIGLVAIILIERMVDLLLGAPGEYRVVLEPTDAFNLEVYGVVSYIKAIVGIVAIFFIVISGIQTVFAEGEEEAITKQRRSVLWIIVGLILIAIDKIIVENLFIQPVTQDDQLSVANVTSLINVVGRVLTFALGFVGLIAFGMLIYGAASMVANYGDEEMVEKGKKIIKNAIIGIIIAISAFTLVATLIGFQ